MNQQCVVTELPNPVGICVSFRRFLLGCQYGNPTRKMCNISRFFYFLFFPVSVKVLPVTPLLSGVFVHGVFCGHFVRFEGAGVMRRFLWCTQDNI